MGKIKNLVLLIFNFLVIISTSLQVFSDESYKDFEGNKSQIVINISTIENVFFERYTIKNFETVTVKLNIKEIENLGYVIFQVHSYAYNMKLSNMQKFSQFGQNLGIVAFESQLLYIENTNNLDVDYAIAVIAYNSSSPVAGGCNMEGNIPESPILALTSLKDIIQVDTPSAAMSVKEDPEQNKCSNAIKPSELSYSGYYYYLPKGDFTKGTYFYGIKRFLLPSNITKIASTAFKKSYKGPANRRIYMQVPGTGMLFNTIVQDSFGTPAAYVPAVTYFCSPFIWEEGCNLIFNDATLKVLSSILIVAGFLKTFLNFEIVSMFIDLIVNLFSVGAFYTFKFIQNSDFSKEAKIGLVITGGIIFTLLFVVPCIFCLQITYILYPVTVILFTWIFTSNAFYIFEGYALESNTVLYWSIFLLTLACCFLMMFPSIRVVWLIFNVIIGGYYMLVGVQFFTKSNLIYIPLKHFYQMDNIDYAHINGYPPSTKTDIYIIVVIVGAIFLGLILRQNKTTLLQRRRGVTEEEQPLLRGSVTGSDNVFVSPRTNILSFRS